MLEINLSTRRIRSARRSPTTDRNILAAKPLAVFARSGGSAKVPLLKPLHQYIGGNHYVLVYTVDMPSNAPMVLFSVFLQLIRGR